MTRILVLAAALLAGLAACSRDEPAPEQPAVQVEAKPSPPQPVQAVGAAPPTLPEPMHSPQVSSRGMRSVVSVPKAASSNVSVRS